MMVYGDYKFGRCCIGESLELAYVLILFLVEMMAVLTKDDVLVVSEKRTHSITGVEVVTVVGFKYN